jgi:trk system potassium uptake protein TrkA
MASSYYVVVVGCGRLGLRLASSLSSDGHRVAVIDRQERALARLGGDFGGFKIVGNATELEVLRRAGVDQADWLLATTDADNVNLMLAQIAKSEFGVDSVIARVYDPARESLYRRLGILTVSPTELSTNAFLAAMFTSDEAG